MIGGEMNPKTKVPLKTENVAVIGRVPKPLKERVEKIVEKLKKSQPQYKWSLNSAIIAGLEAFIEKEN